MFFNPFEQFQIQSHFLINKSYSDIPFFNHNIYITDTLIVSLWIVLFYIILFYFLQARRKKYTSSKILFLFKNIYIFAYSTVDTYLTEEGKMYFPFIFYLFTFICTANLIGILPYSITVTSHLSITFSLAIMVWLSILIIGFQENGLRFFSLFFPSGIPFKLVPFLTIIEVISYIFRSVSLALRLFANIVAGHILLDTLALFIHKTIYPATFSLSSIFIAIIPFIMCIVLILFECIVAILQGYIFVILTCIYLRESLSSPGH